MPAPDDRIAGLPSPPLAVTATLAACVALWLAMLTLGVTAEFSDIGKMTALTWLVATPLLSAALRRATALFARSGAGDPVATTLSVVAPLALLPLAALGRGASLPSLPIVLALCCGISVALRGAAALRRPLSAADRRWLELLGMAAIVAPGLFLFQTTIVHDAFQYQATAVSLLLDRDFELFDELFLHNSHRSYNPYAEGGIRYLGVPLLELPGLVAAHLGGRLLSPGGTPFPANGFSHPYAVAISLTSSLAGVLGLALTLRWVARRVGTGLAFAAVALMTWASAVPFFTFLWHGWTHTYSLLGVAIFLLLRDRVIDHEPSGYAAWFALGIAGGLLCLIWPMNGLVLLLPAVDLLTRLQRRPSGGLGTVLLGVALTAGLLLGFSPQFAGWHAATGSWLAASYGKVGDSFHWGSPHVLGTLFSGARHGLISWHPVWAPALLGLFAVRDRSLRLALLGWAVLHIYAMSSWSVWWGGIGFGNRFFLGLMPVATLGLARVMQFAAGSAPAPGARSMRVLAIAAVAVLLVTVNLSMIAAYRLDRIAMGIKGPELVQDASPGTVETLRMLLVDHPPEGRSLTRDFGVNQTLFTTRLGLLWWGSSAGRWGGTALLVTLFAGTWFATTRRALRDTDDAAPPGPVSVRGVVLVGGGIAMVATALLFAGPSAPAHEFTRIAPGDRTLEAGQRAELVPQASLRPSAGLDLVSFLTRANDVPQGRVVARVHVHFEHGGKFTSELRAGMETAEIGAQRYENRGRLAHDATQVPVAHEWMTRAYGDWYYPAHAYLAHIDFPHSARVERVEIEMMPGAGQLTLRDLFLREP